MSTANTCNICAETYNKSSRVPVACLHCQFSSCRTCCETYLVTVPDARCMNTACGKPWTRKFMSESMTKSFLTKGYKQYLEKVCFEKEQALLPATQLVIEARNKQKEVNAAILKLNRRFRDVSGPLNWLHQKRADAKEEYEMITDEMGSLRGELAAAKAEHLRLSGEYAAENAAAISANLQKIAQIKVKYAEYTQERSKAKEVHSGLTQDVRAIELQKQAIRMEIWNLQHPNQDAAEPEVKQRKQFIRRCANTEAECRGFLSTSWKCGLCELYTCNMCHELKGEDHECNPDNVKTVELKAKDTKPCPKCGVEITKIDGCDQMWCTDCHTAFSWDKGTIETKIHNPHYYEWMRRNGAQQREAGDVPCGRELNHRIMPNAFYKLDTALWSRHNDLLQKTLHIQLVEMPKYQTDQVVNNEELRILYMTHHISDADFKVQLQRSAKKHDKKREIHGILALFVQSATDMMFRCLDSFEKIDHFLVPQNRVMYGVATMVMQFEKVTAAAQIQVMHGILDEFDPLVEYVNECLLDVAGTFDSVPLCVDLKNTDHTQVVRTVSDKKGKRAAV